MDATLAAIAELLRSTQQTLERLDRENKIKLREKQDAQEQRLEEIADRLSKRVREAEAGKEVSAAGTKNNCADSGVGEVGGEATGTREDRAAGGRGEGVLLDVVGLEKQADRAKGLCGGLKELVEEAANLNTRLEGLLRGEDTRESQV